MPASTTSSLSSRSSSMRSTTSIGTHQSSSRRDQKLILRSESGFDENSSVASSTSSRSSISTLFRSTNGSRISEGVPVSLATSYASLRDLELRKIQIEHELAQVQHELQQREAQQAAAKLQTKLKGKKDHV